VDRSGIDYGSSKDSSPKDSNSDDALHKDIPEHLSEPIASAFNMTAEQIK